MLSRARNSQTSPPVKEGGSASKHSGSNFTTQRYSTSIWARREEGVSASPMRRNGNGEKPEEKRNASHHQSPEFDSASHTVFAARRNARWANREEERKRTSPDMTSKDNDAQRSLSPLEHVSSQRTRTNSREFISDAFQHESQSPRDQREGEPMSLKIKLSYEDDPPSENRQCQRVDDSVGRSYNGTASHLADKGVDLSVRISRSSVSHSAQYPNLTRSASDENLNLSSQQDARLSPAFRRALSPELLHSIGNRSPLLGRNIERSLAQPPSHYPAYQRSNRSTSPIGHRVYRPDDPPTFLARERSFSPREQMYGPSRERTYSPSRDRKYSPSRERTFSPSRERAYSPFRERQYSPNLRERALSPSRAALSTTERVERVTSPYRERRELASSTKEDTSYPLRGRASSPSRNIAVSSTRERPLPARGYGENRLYEDRRDHMSPAYVMNARPVSPNLLDMDENVRTRIGELTSMRRSVAFSLRTFVVNPYNTFIYIWR